MNLIASNILDLLKIKKISDKTVSKVYLIGNISSEDRIYAENLNFKNIEIIDIKYDRLNIIIQEIKNRTDIGKNDEINIIAGYGKVEVAVSLITDTNEGVSFNIDGGKIEYENHYIRRERPRFFVESMEAIFCSIPEDLPHIISLHHLSEYPIMLVSGSLFVEYFAEHSNDFKAPKESNFTLFIKSNDDIDFENRIERLDNIITFDKHDINKILSYIKKCKILITNIQEYIEIAVFLRKKVIVINPFYPLKFLENKNFIKIVDNDIDEVRTAMRGISEQDTCHTNPPYLLTNPTEIILKTLNI